MKAMLCAISRRTPAARAAAARFGVPSMRMRALRRSASAYCGVPGAKARSVSWWMTASGFATTTARFKASASKTSTTTGSAPMARIAPALSAERVMPAT